MIKIGLDFDGTLSESWVQEFAKCLSGVCELWIFTSRSPGHSHNKDLYKISEMIGIPDERIIFTDGGYKASSLLHYGINIHFDDMEDEILEINKEGGCQGVLVGLKSTEDLWYLFNNKKLTNI